MRCPVCKHSLTKAQEILSQIEDVYYCPHCWVRIADREAREKEAKESEESVKSAAPAAR
jgi:Zn-finger nucleic acid-binding protein